MKRCILLGFQVVSRLNIKLAKSVLVRLGDGRDASKLASILICKCVELFIKYLGLLLGTKYKEVSY